MSALRAQLMRLAQQAGRRGEGQAASSAHALAPTQESTDRLHALLAQRQRLACRDLPGTPVAPGVRHVTTAAPNPLFGATITPVWLDVGPIAIERLVLLDTETTGLAGGTGTKAFLVGLATLTPAAIQVQQWLLTQLAGEAALLRALAQALPPEPVLVTYNGKSFDLPLLRTRYRMQRLREPFGDALHLDLLNPVRRRYRREWPNCRLATVEARLLGRPRSDDLPGSEAPAAWRDFLLTGQTHDLRRVLTHNARDLVSLAHVLAQLQATALPARVSMPSCAVATP